MKIVYLITSYRDPNHLKRLIKSLNIADSYFYIHVDKKVDIREFTVIIKDENVKFIDKRYHIYWGDYSQVESITALIAAMLAGQEKEIDRVVLISGQDYPIKSNTEIINIFKDNPYKQFIIGYNITKASSEHQEKIKRYHFLNVTNKRERYWLERIFRLIFFEKNNQVYFNGKFNDVYFGSDYWALTFECVVYAYQIFCTESKIRNYFRQSFVQSELFMHTIIFNSEYSKEAQICEPIEYKGLYTCTPLHYIVYREEIKVFQEEDYETLINSSKMFFRKATTEISTKLLDKIDKLRNPQN